MIKNVLTVCVGNICRSPVAELLLRHYLAEQGKDIDVRSAGLRAIVGAPLDAMMRAELPPGIDSEHFVARNLEYPMVQQADLVLVAERYMIDKIVGRWPGQAGKAFLLCHWNGQGDIPDPFRKDAVYARQAYELIDDCVKAWLPYL